MQYIASICGCQAPSERPDQKKRENWAKQYPVQLSQDVKLTLERIADRLGVPQKVVVERLLRWFAALSEAQQSLLIGLIADQGHDWRSLVGNVLAALADNAAAQADELAAAKKGRKKPTE